MPILSFQILRHKGFVLLQALWLLIFASLLTMSVMATSLDVARNSSVAIAAIQAELAAESAVHQVLHDLIKYGSQHAWPRKGQATTILVDGAEVSVCVTNANGLVDLNVANDEVMRRIVTAVLPSTEAASLVSHIKEARPIPDYSSLATIEGMSLERFKLLSPHVTLFSRNGVPSYDEAPIWLARIMHLKQESSGVLSDSISVTGNVFRIDVIARVTGATSRKLSAEVLLTGRLDQPYWVYDWSWHFLDESARGAISDSDQRYSLSSGHVPRN